METRFFFFGFKRPITADYVSLEKWVYTNGQIKQNRGSMIEYFNIQNVIFNIRFKNKIFLVV